MPVNLATLKTEIALPAYSAMTDLQIADTINAAPLSRLRAISPNDAMIQLMRVGDWGWLAGVANGFVTSANASGAGAVAVSATTPWATRRMALVLYDLFRSSLDIDLSVQANVTAITSAIDALVTANVLTAAGKAALVALPTVAAFKWSTFSDRPLDYADIVAARAS